MFYATIKRYDEEETQRVYFNTEKGLKDYIAWTDKTMYMFWQVIESGEVQRISIDNIAEAV